MAHPVPLIKYIFSAAVLIVCCAHCSNQEGTRKPETLQAPPSVFIHATDPRLQNDNGLWRYDRGIFNGYIQEMDSGRVVSHIPIVNGHENGWAYGWYASGSRKFERFFVNGKREGKHVGWHRNGKLSFILHFKNDKYDGLQQGFHKNGKLRNEQHYKNGREEGRQCMWNDSGRLTNNYTIKNGKLYGVVGRFDCVSTHKKNT